MSKEPLEKKIDPVLELFRTDLKDKIKLLNPDELQSQQPLNYDPISLLHEIKAEARLIRQETLYQLFEQMENLFIEFLGKHQPIQLSENSVLKNALNLLREFCELDASRAVAWLERHQSQFEEATQRLKKQEEKPATDLFVSPSEELILDNAMMEIFLTEVQVQTTVLNTGLMYLEEHSESEEVLNALMRAAHSIKGAARVVSLKDIVQLAHVMEDYFVAAKQKKITLSAGSVDILLEAVDFLEDLSKTSSAQLAERVKQKNQTIALLVKKVSDLLQAENVPLSEDEASPQFILEESDLPSAKSVIFDHISKKLEEPAANLSDAERVLRVTAENLNRLMGLAGEALVESHWLQPFSTELLKLSKEQGKLGEYLEQLRNSLDKEHLSEKVSYYLDEVQEKGKEYLDHFSERYSELEMFIRRHSNLSDRLYREVIASRMRPFADGVEAFPRMIRDLAHLLHKKVRLQIIGRKIPVDREILEKLEAPLGHLLRNSVDHGIELPEERIRIGKPPEGLIKLEAEHRGGMLIITVSDDGRGVDLSTIREAVIKKKLVNQEIGEKLSEKELIDFLFLPGFTTSEKVTEISGRGIGLNIVQNIVLEVGGKLQVNINPGKGVVFQLQLPLTLSVMRALIVKISGEAYAFPLARIESALLISKENIQFLENQQYFKFEGINIGLVSAYQILKISPPDMPKDIYPVILLRSHASYYGLVVDSFLGEREIVVQELDKRLGKIPDLSAGALMEDGTPLLILDVEDLVHSIDALLTTGQLEKVHQLTQVLGKESKKRILVIDDSITVREIERRLLQNNGYEVDMAINGVDGWNALKIVHYDLVITDLDMPRMNGIELVRQIKNDPQLKTIPVMIISYKEKEEDRLLGLAAGANYYLSKSSFHEESLLNAVQELIGKP